ncbi:hypothetical protein KFL_000280190 [Klebsormidium nitens]|uniref:Uncharacterized protein n=1 Tax=Klebsormidium nitens TaxID=105231 RepID=A0A1Y1HL26_KLENI|nr:hypothetical protein KFL_000280190 [Klebsormidium nitens]|eukprot:GAQ79314.1 hypothetical protein KFL_000280190 [Klebsormidium nitens]
MEVEVQLSEAQQSRISGYEHEAAAHLIQELVKFCLYDQGLTPSIYDTLKATCQQSGSTQNLGTTRRKISDRRTYKFVAGVEKMFDAITATSIAALDSKAAVLLIGPSLLRPSIIYQFDFRVLNQLRQPDAIESTSQSGTIQVNSSSICEQPEPADSQREQFSVSLLREDENFDAVQKPIEIIAKKVVRALVMNASRMNFGGNIQGTKKMHVLLLGACVAEAPRGLLPKRNVPLDHKKAQVVKVVLVGSKIDQMVSDLLSNGGGQQTWYQCGDSVKGLRSDGTQ